MIVLQVSANANWNKKNARNATPVVPYVAGALFRKKYWCPIQPLPDAEHEREAERPEQQCRTDRCRRCTRS